MSEMEYPDPPPLSHTLVGICAEGSEDWSREFLLDDDDEVSLPSSLQDPSHSLDNLTLKDPSTILIPHLKSLDPMEEEEDWTFEEISTPLLPNKELNENITFEVHSEEEDWDVELGISEEIKEAQDYLADGLRLVINNTSDHIGTIEDTIMPELTSSESLPLTLPSRCKVTSNLLNYPSDYSVVLYPKPPSLYSLKFDKGRKQFPARDFNDWLQIIVSEHKSRVERASRGKNLQWLNQIKLEEKALTLKVISSWSQYIQILWRAKDCSDDELSTTLVQFQQLLQQEQSMKTLLPSIDSLDDLFEYLCHILRISLIVSLNQSIVCHRNSLRESQNSQKKSPTKKKLRIIFQFQILLTETPSSPRPNTNSKQLKNPNHISINCCQNFHDLFQVIIGLYPLFKEKFAVFELQCLTYYCAMMLENQIEGSWSPKPPTILQYYLKLYQQFLSNDRKHRSLNHLSPTSSSSEAVRQGNLLKLTLFCDLFLFVNGYNALTVSPHTTLQTLMSEFSQTENDPSRGSESEDGEEDEDDEEVESEPTDLSGESSDLEGTGSQGHSKQNLSQDISLNWKTTNLSWLQPPTFLGPGSDEERRDEDTTSNETNGFLTKKDSNVSDVFEKENQIHEKDPKLTSNRSNNSLSSDNFTVISSNTSPISSMTSSLLEEILSEEDISMTTILHFFKKELNNIYTLFQAKYPYVSRRYFLKSKLVFSLAIMLTVNNLSQLSSTDPTNTNELTESYFFECLFLLDRQSKEKYYELSPPLLSSFGLHLFDKFADILMKNTKYKFGLTCLESLLFCHTAASIGNSNIIIGNGRAPVHEIKIIYRRLITVSQFVNDIQKLLLYYVKMLQIAKKENKLNEFVYLLEMISKQLSEIGEYQFAERCMSVVCLLHFGTPLLSIEFEKIDITQLDWTELPQGFELPRVSSNTPPAASSGTSQSTGSGLWNLRTNTPNSASTFTPRSGPSQQLTCDSQQLSSLLKLIDIYMISDQYQTAIEYCLSLLKRKVFPQGRAQILLQLSKCFLKQRKLDLCEATLDRIAFEADEIVSLLYNKQTQFDGNHSNSSNDLQMLSSPRKVPTARYHRSSIDSSAATARFSLTSSNPDLKSYQREHSKSTSSEPPVIVSASALTYVSKIKSYAYLYLRAKCRFLANDPEWAIHWLQIALSVCPKGKWDWRAKIRYLIGKSFSALSLRCRYQTQISHDHQNAELQMIENSFASSAEEEFMNSIALSKKNTDIIKQIKCRNRIIELQSSRLFHSMVVGGNSLQTGCNNKGESILKSIENLCRLNLQQVGDTSTPLELIRTLVNCSEISWLQENFTLASSSWFEALNLLTITYLQHLFVDGKKKNPKDGRIPHPSYMITDVNNPLLDIPVLAIPFSTGMITKIYDVLSKLITLGFFIEPSPLNMNGATLLSTWIRLNHFLKKNVSPLFAESQFLQKSLASYSRVFSASSSVPTPDSRRNTVDKFSPHSSPLLAEEIKSEIGPTFPLPNTIPLPQEQLKPHLTRPILSTNRRSKNSSQSSSSFNESVGYILQDQTDIPGIMRQLSRHKSCDNISPHLKNRQIMRSYSDVAVAEDIDGLVMEVVGATSNILLPFEMMRKAMALESHLDSASKEGLKATEAVLQHLRLAGKNALLSNYGEDAKNILSRAAAPGLTLTLEGYFVPGVLDNSSAESLARSLQDTGVDGFHREDVLDLLKKSPARQLSKSPFGIGIFQEKISRQLVLFIRLKVFSVQYTEGRISLTELYKKNSETLRRIAKPLRQNPELTKIDRPKNTLSEIPLDDGALDYSADNIQTSEDDKPGSDASPNDFLIAQSASFPNLTSEFSPSDYSTLYPPSCRFVLLMENFLFLYLPFHKDASVMILKEKIKSLKIPNLKDCHLEPTKTQSIDQLSDYDTLSNATQTTINSLIEPTNAEEIGGVILIDEKDADSKNFELKSYRNYKPPNFRSMRSQSESRMMRNRKIGTRRKKSGYLTWKSTSSTNTISSTGLSDGKDDSFFALSGILGRESITPLYPLFYQCSDYTVSDALTSLPTPMEEDLSQFHEITSEILTNDNKTKTKIKVDPSVFYSLQTVGFQNLFFLLNALMMEEPILLLCNPGAEQKLLHISTTLLRLLRPLCWQHLYIPFMQSTMQSIFRKALKSREPFLIGTYFDVVDGLPEAMSASLRNSLPDYLGSTQGGAFSDVILVDVETGKVVPNRRMQFAATCTLSPSGGVIPEADPIYLNTLLEKLDKEKERSGTITFKPPLPARYRYDVYLKLIRTMHPDEYPFLSVIPQYGGKKISIKESKLSKVSVRFVDSLQRMMCSLLKGLYFTVKFENDSNPEDRRSQPRHVRGSTTGSEFSLISRGLFDEDLFVLDLKDDVKPFLQYLFRTRAFKKLVEDISESKRISRKSKTLSNPPPQISTIYPSLLQLLSIAQTKLVSRQEYFTTLSVERLTGFMTTYFLKMSDPGQPYPFFYIFPYGSEDVLKNKQRKASVKIKRRWCVLDAQTLTYYKSRSQRLIKDHIRIDPTNVRLITAPYCQPLIYPANGVPQNLIQYSASPATVDNHQCAIEYGENMVLVFRMDTIDEQVKWIMALKARLFPQVTEMV